jgi:hypothetical protein
MPFVGVLKNHFGIERTVKIFGIGLNKTGTTTLSGCLQTLGYSHMSLRIDLLKALKAGHAEQVLKEIDHYDSFEDWPYPLMYRELDEKYGSDAKFILTVRKSPEIWLRSLERHSMHTPPRAHCRKLIYGYNYPQYSRRQHLEYYNRHNREVEDYFARKPGRLLVICWENGDGWTQLCEFLGEPLRKGPVAEFNVSSARARSGYELCNLGLMMAYSLASVVPGMSRLI